MVNESKIHIRKGAIAEAVQISQSISELDNPHDEEVYKERLEGKKHLVAIAEIDGVLAGFKVGYDKFGNDSFYTWMGGVLPAYRQMGVAKALADFQESYARAQGFDSVILKTRNRHKNMLLFALSSGFEIIDVEPMEPSEENRILLKKRLN